MKGYVYMIDWREEEQDYFGDQIECCDKDDLLQQLRLIAGETSNVGIVDEIKLVKASDRYVEKPISKSLQIECKKILRDKYKTA